MSTIDLQALRAATKDAGLDWTPPAGANTFQVTKTNVNEPDGSKPGRIGAQLKSTVGPNAGRSFWHNFRFDPSKEKATAITFQQLAALGLDDSFFAAAPSLQQVADALLGIEFTCEVKLAAKQQGDGHWVNLSGIKRSSPAAAPAPAASPPPQQQQQPAQAQSSEAAGTTPPF